MSISLTILGIFTIMQLNCENLFDCQHDSLKNDQEFLPTSVRRWTPHRYWRKLDKVGKTIITAGMGNPNRTKGDNELIPDIVTLCEVENDSVVRDLTKRSLLRKMRYEYFVTSSPDQRGIDVALLYQPTSFRPVNHYSIGVGLLDNGRPTRDILYVKGAMSDGDTLHVFVVHAPSRLGGEKASRPNRMKVARRLCQSIDSVKAISPDALIAVSGDFNDYHDSPALMEIYRYNIFNATLDAKGQNGALGTYYYKGEWNSIDHILLSDDMKGMVEATYVNDPKFLLDYDKTNGVYRPYRTYRGMKYQKRGSSDHLPLILCIRKK